MLKKNFEVTIICSQGQSKAVIETIRKLDLDFDVLEERAFAPATPEIAVRIFTVLAQLLPIIIALVKELWKRKAYVDFETRRRLAKEMLEDLKPLYWITGKDTPQYSYYEFKTAKCKHYWELDRGEITHGPLRCPKTGSSI